MRRFDLEGPEIFVSGQKKNEGREHARRVINGDYAMAGKQDVTVMSKRGKEMRAREIGAVGS